ncbi:MAG: hypothetical protein IJT18_03335 [Oscillospiraceae bacterium]|nr:hypothetical protein [Oscillospiraceae bacterium]
MTDYLTRLLKKQEDLWQPDETDGVILLRTADARTEKQTAVRRTPSAEAAWQIAQEQSAEAQFAETLAAADQAQTAVMRLETLRETRLYVTANQPQTVRTGPTGSPSDEQSVTPSEAALSMAAISRYFERDARRYG